ncbi:MAG: HIT family protein [Brooklawnia sp.]
MATVFSKIINGEFSGLFAWADDRCVAISTIAPISDGHLMVIPRDEVAAFTTADDDLLAHLIKVTAIIGRAQEQAFEAPRAAVIIAGFEVPHLHVHVLPAWGEDQLTFANAREGVPSEELAANTEKVRAALREQGHGAHVPVSINSPGLGS